MPSKQLADALRIIAELDPEELVDAIDALDYGEEGAEEGDMERPFPGEEPELPEFDEEAGPAEELDEEEEEEEEKEDENLPPAKYKKKK